MTDLDVDEPGGPFRLHDLDGPLLEAALLRWGPRATPSSGEVRAGVHLKRNGRPRAMRRSEWSFEVSADESGVDAVAEGVTLRVERAPLSAHAAVDDDEDALTVVTNAVRWLMAYAVLEDGGLLLHSAGIVEPGGGAWLLAAPSGTGKSTLCARHEEAAHEVLSDDLNVAWPNAMEAEGASRSEKPALRKRVPLRGVGALLRGKQVALTRSEGAHALGRLFAAAPFVNGDPLVIDTCMDRCAALVARLNTVDLRMTLDRDAHAQALRALESV